MRDQADTKNTSQLGTLAELLTKPREGYETAFDVVSKMGEGGKKTTRLEVSRRKLQPEEPEELPREASGPRQHTFFAVSGFIDYLRKFGTEHTVLLADPSTRTVQAVLDEQAEEGFEVVSLTPQVHPRWEPWRSLHGRRISVSDLLDFIRMNRKSIVEPNGRELVFLLSQVTCATEVTMHQGKGADSINGVMVTTSIRGGGGKDTGPVVLPESIKVRSPVWVDQEPMDMELDLVLGAKRDGTEVYAQLASADIREAEVTAFDELIGSLREGLDAERFTVAFGSHKAGQWTRVRDRA